MHSLARSVLPAEAPSRSQTEPTDFEAVNAVIGGQREMFEVIVRRYNTQLYRVGLAYLRDHAMAEDAMQNTYLKAFLNLHRFRGTAAFSTWLTRIMINECLMALRSRKRFIMETLDDGNRRIDHEFFAEPVPDSIDAEDVKKVLEHLIEGLPRTHRAVYLLREVQHLSTEETAECLGMTRDNVKVCLHRAREELKAQLLKSAAGVELFAYPAQYCDPMTSKVMQAVLGAP
jgi:RNA polymerase sigma-70 factor (ECF subfamily)